MTETTKIETHGFQAEVKQLLKLVINSLYSNDEIFLRELISNSSDALDKLRFKAVSETGLYENDSDLKITVDFDEAANTITIRDNGIGMNHDEVIANLGTIAKSGTKEFLASLSGEQTKDAKLIGQFGVGFYSAFIVADKVVVNTRRAGLSEDKAVRWISSGEGEYSIEPIKKADRGTEVILHLKKDKNEFLSQWRLQNIITKYSDHIPFSVYLKKEVHEEVDGEEQAEAKTKIVYEPVNKATALWTLAKKDVKDDEYIQFYKHISHDFDDPLLWSHNRVEGKLEYTNLLYIPKRPPFDLFNRDKPRGLKLYVQRVFIMDDAEQFLPMYLRFVKGVIDSNDLPLNISREILQNNKTVESIRTAVTKRVLDTLETLAKEDKEKYAIFWKNFGEVLKEGTVEDYANREQIAKLIRFSTTVTDNETQDVSFADYVARMKEGQDKIYYVTAESFNAAKNSPHLEIFRKKGIEVVLLYNRVDEWLVSHLTDYEGKALQSVAKGDLDLGEMETELEKEEHKETEKQFDSMLKQIKQVLDGKIKDVRITHRLTNSPACVVADENDMGIQLQRMLQAAGQDLPESKPILELNPEHTIIVRMRDEHDDARFNEWAHILFEQSVLAEGGQLDDPAGFVNRFNKMILNLLGE